MPEAERFSGTPRPRKGAIDPGGGCGSSPAKVGRHDAVPSATTDFGIGGLERKLDAVYEGQIDVFDVRYGFVNILAIIAAALGLLALSFFLWRRSDIRADGIAWDDLLRQAGEAGPAFDPTVLDSLPEPARRYFRYTISPGAPLVSVAEIDMLGELGFGTRDEPAYRPMAARQILAPPNGLVWRLRAGPISGSDGATPVTSWTRFWLLHLIPVVRISDDSDHHRSAFGRVVAEGAFWVPSSLLPGERVTWEPVDENTARAIVSYRDDEQTVELTVAPDGRPTRVLIQRWSNQNPQNEYRRQPFGGYLSEFREIDGYRLPMRVEGGNHIGTADYFPFYRAEVQEMRFPQLDSFSRQPAAE
jgi:hypothetical protein